MTAELFRIILPVTNIDQASAFYAAVLGMPGERISNGRHYFDCGGTILACFDPRADGDNFDARPLPDHIYFAVLDIESTYEACIKAGATMMAGDIHGTPAGAIAVRPWGERSFYAVDPFGNQICFVDATTKFTTMKGKRLDLD